MTTKSLGGVAVIVSEGESEQAHDAAEMIALRTSASQTKATDGEGVRLRRTSSIALCHDGARSS